MAYTMKQHEFQVRFDSSVCPNSLEFSIRIKSSTERCYDR